MENNFSLKMYLEGYENVVKKANDLVAVDLDGRKKELESQIKEAESKVNSMTGMTSKQFQQKSKLYMELIKNNEKEINRINDEKIKRVKNPERQQEAEELEEAKKRIIESAKEAANKAELVISDKINSIEKPLNDVKREKAELEKQLKDLEDQEKADPQRAKDVKYKEFLKEKIKPLDEKIKDMEPGIKKELKSLNSKELLNAIKEELRRFLLNTGKIDRNEPPIPMADDIAKQNKEEKQRKEERSERKYNKAWIEAIKENRARDEQKAAEIKQENAKPEQEPVKVEQEDTKTKQEKDENAEDILGVYDSSDVTGELPDDIEITLGRKGSIVYDGEKYRIPRKALRNVDELDWNDMVESIKETGMLVENEELLKAALKTKSIDYAVINGICNAKKMENGDKAIILNNYFKDCFKSSDFKNVENVCNINYDLKDLSKTSLMTGLSKYAFLQRAERAERFNVGHRTGEFKPTLLSKLIARIRGENLEKLAEKNENRAYENATIVNEALGKEKEEAKSFLRGLRVEEPIDLGKDKGKAELDLDQLHEIKRVYVEENKKRDDEGR